MSSFDITMQAADDLRSIVLYTAKRWGAQQVRQYMSGLDNHMELMAAGVTHAKPLDEMLSGLKVGKYERHMIFAVQHTGEPMLVLAVFHEKMNLMNRLRKRL